MSVEDRRHPTVDAADQIVTRDRDDDESPEPFSGAGVLPVIPETREPKCGAVFPGDGVGLLSPIGGLPFEKAVHGNDALLPFDLGIDGLPPAGRVLQAMGDQSPSKQVKGPLAGLVVFPDDQEVLPWCSVVAAREIGPLIIPHIQPIDDGEAEGTRCLDDAATHGEFVWLLNS